MWWVLACLGCGLAYWVGSWRVFGGVLLITGMWCRPMSALDLRLQQRWETYQAALNIAWEHPWGVGAGPVALPTLCRISGMPLPGPHSDWLAGLLLHGWLATFLMLVIVWKLLVPKRLGRAGVAQAGLLSLLLMALGRSMVVSPGYVLLVAMCSVLLIKKESA